MRIIFMGTPEFAVPALQELINSEHQIIAVYTRPPQPAGRGQKEQLSAIHSLALAHNLTVKTPAGFREPETHREFCSLEADLAVVAAYGLILPVEILTAARFGCINIHPSLLPRWRGAAPIQRCIMAGDDESGVCIMQMSKGLDDGPVLAMEKIALDDKITAGELHDRLALMGAQLLIETIEELPDIKPIAQDDSGVTYAHKLTKSEARIDWNLPAPVINWKVRAFNPWPGCFFTYNNENIKILTAEYSDSSTKVLPGTVIDNKLAIACGHGILKPVVVQKPGRRPMPVLELLRGFKIVPGDILQ